MGFQSRRAKPVSAAKSAWTAKQGEGVAPNRASLPRRFLAGLFNVQAYHAKSLISADIFIFDFIKSKKSSRRKLIAFQCFQRLVEKWAF
ncbi:hypothetical protein DSM3645_09482 [Blastopirellula marina DSM 3645]|uniref:Uncharacterized protein n=1 Tax=Blastopirellula marina DSM 3645 TaxID=314230 RepID=A3ZLI7_9BACT|nr:hypothetical protein DSM3645_09482 [Blastopirellula marina DSM 3645]